MTAQVVASPRSVLPVRPLATLLAVTFGLLAGVLFITGNGRAYAWVIPGARVVLTSGMAETVAAAISGTADLSRGSTGGGGGGTGIGEPDGYESPDAKNKGRAGRMLELVGVLAGLAAFEIPWRLRDGQDPGYADAPASDVYPAGAWTFPATFEGQASKCTTGSTNVYCVAGEQSGPVTLTRSTGWSTSVAGTITARLYCSGPGVTSVQSSPAVIKGVAPATATTPSCPEGQAGSSVEFYSTGTGVIVRYGFTGGTIGSAGEENPSVTTTSTTRCSDGSSITSSIQYRPGDETFPPVQVGGCPSGSRTVGVDQTTTRDSDGATVPSPLSETGGTVYQEPVIPDGYAQCNPIGSCELTLLRMSPAGEVLGNCANTGLCAQWQTQASPSTGTRSRTITRPDGSTATESAWVYPDRSWLDCRYGPYVVATAECSIVPTEPAGPPQAPPSEGNCNLSDFSLNPVSWVVVPLKCLFIPRQSAVNATGQGIADAWDGSAPAVAVDIASGLVTPFAQLPTSKGSCEGPEVTLTLPIMGDTAMRPFNACLPLIDLILSYLIPIESAGLYAAALLRGSRMVARTVGAETV